MTIQTHKQKSDLLTQLELIRAITGKIHTTHRTNYDLYESQNIF